MLLLYLYSFFLVGLSFLLSLLWAKTSSQPNVKPKNLSSSTTTSSFPISYPIIGSIFSILANKRRRVPWLSDILQISPSQTFTLHRPFGYRQVFTANPAVVQHILKTHFPIYQKGDISRRALADFLGDGIFNADGQTWKFQRQISSHEFNTRSLRNFVETVVDTELTHRLLPILSSAAKTHTILDLQDILQRFTFDNICKIAFGFDPEYLLASLPEANFPNAFEEGTRIISERLNASVPLIWKIKRFLNLGSEKQLAIAISEVRDFARKIIREKKLAVENKVSTDSNSLDLLSRFLNSGHNDEDFVTDIVISFILAGRDTTSAALTWFFWLIHKNPFVEDEILAEIKEKSETPMYEEVKSMVYIHATLCESMRLYPPVPVDTKAAACDDVLPDGTLVKKGMRVAYHVYAMGRSERLWGLDWAEFRPERWLERVGSGDRWRFVQRDPFTYPVFQAGPRVCLGKDMAFLQMKRLVAGILSRFKVVPAVADGFEPEFISDLTSKMKGGFPVRIKERVENLK